jgi:hypothetical protein
MTKSLTPDLSLRYFDATLVTNHSAMLHALVLSAQAFPVSDRAEDAGAEKPVALRFECSIIYCLRLGNLTMRPVPNLLRRSK